MYAEQIKQNGLACSVQLGRFSFCPRHHSKSALTPLFALLANILPQSRPNSRRLKRGSRGARSKTAA